jgi:CRISPR/Cas system CMR-associated protein Cmr5 small subunit
MKEARSSFEITVLTGATRRNMPEDDILHSRSCENFKSYTEKILLICNWLDSVVET